MENTSLISREISNLISDDVLVKLIYFWNHFVCIPEMPSPHERTEHNESGKGFKAKLGTSRLVSYEDLLIAQYIDEIKKPPDVSQKTRWGTWTCLLNSISNS